MLIKYVFPAADVTPVYRSTEFVPKMRLVTSDVEMSDVEEPTCDNTACETLT